MDKITLKPCFCGGHASFSMNPHGYDESTSWAVVCDGINGETMCTANVHGYIGQEAAAAAWNNRPDIDALRSFLREIKEDIMSSRREFFRPLGCMAEVVGPGAHPEADSYQIFLSREQWGKLEALTMAGKALPQASANESAPMDIPIGHQPREGGDIIGPNRREGKD